MRKEGRYPQFSNLLKSISEFAESQLAERVHAVMIERHFGDQLIGHTSRDSTAIVAREKPIKSEDLVIEPVFFCA